VNQVNGLLGKNAITLRLFECRYREIRGFDLSSVEDASRRRSPNDVISRQPIWRGAHWENRSV
jgi:hypothetical protein